MKAAQEFPLMIGNELTGVIEKIGKKVKSYNVGDAIYSLTVLFQEVRDHLGKWPFLSLRQWDLR